VSGPKTKKLVPVPLDFLQSVQWLLEMPITREGFDTEAEYDYLEDMRVWLDDVRRWIDDAEAVVESA
jgi:hypothetical protein